MLPGLGALAFGAMLGWITYRTLRRKEGKASWEDLATVIATLAGAGITAIFQVPALFGAYCLGLGGGFFGYLRYAAYHEEAWKREARKALDEGKPLPPDPPFGSVGGFLSEEAGRRSRYALPPGQEAGEARPATGSSRYSPSGPVDHP